MNLGIGAIITNHRKAAEQLDPPSRLGKSCNHGDFAKQRSLDVMID